MKELYSYIYMSSNITKSLGGYGLWSVDFMRILISFQFHTDVIINDNVSLRTNCSIYKNLILCQFVCGFSFFVMEMWVILFGQHLVFN